MSGAASVRPPHPYMFPVIATGKSPFLNLQRDSRSQLRCWHQILLFTHQPPDSITDRESWHEACMLLLHTQHSRISAPMSWQRIRTDFRFAIITLFSMVAVLVVLPFAFYRFAQGQVLAGIGDMAIVLTITAAGIHVWRGGNIERASLLTVITFNIGCLIVAHLVGVSSALWMYPVLVANFMLIERRMAIAISTVALLVLALSPGIFDSGVPRTAFVVTAAVVCVFGFIFAYQTDSQHTQLEALASHDPLTGIQNRRAMERELAIALESSRRQRTSYALAVVDLDRFKRINDKHGHEAGDAVLIEFTQLITCRTRKGDRFFRMGGEEFVLLLPGTDAATLLPFCEHLRERIAAELWYEGDAITVSIGAAALEHGESAASWLARADKAMYQAKHRGRNQVVVHPGRDVDFEPPA